MVLGGPGRRMFSPGGSLQLISDESGGRPALQRGAEGKG